jgi:cbb3-type cytochrome oxidase subunit 1
VGGLLYLAGALLMAFNLWKTATMRETAPAAAASRLAVEAA